MTGNLKQIYLYLRYMFVLYHTILFYFIVHVKLCVTEIKCFIFFINIISVQVNQSALLNVLKNSNHVCLSYVIMQWYLLFTSKMSACVLLELLHDPCNRLFTQQFVPSNLVRQTPPLLSSPRHIYSAVIPQH